MSRIIIIAVAMALLSAPALADENPNPPPQSESDRRDKGEVCQWECVEWDDDGYCSREAYVCH